MSESVLSEERVAPTQGPWEVSDDGECIVATDANGEKLVIVRAMHGNEADMQQIAAVPDLLEALQAMLNEFGSTDALSGRARAAIAKATQP